jgi:hypothetical protein
VAAGDAVEVVAVRDMTLVVRPSTATDPTGAQSAMARS